VRRCVHPRCIVPSLRPSFLRSRFMRLRQVLRGCATAVPLPRPSGDESLKVTSCARVRRLARFSSAEAADPPQRMRVPTRTLPSRSRLPNSFRINATGLSINQQTPICEDTKRCLRRSPNRSTGTAGFSARRIRRISAITVAYSRASHRQ